MAGEPLRQFLAEQSQKSEEQLIKSIVEQSVDEDLFTRRSGPGNSVHETSDTANFISQQTGQRSNTHYTNEHLSGTVSNPAEGTPSKTNEQ